MPVQISAYVEFAVTGPVDCVPDVDFVPDHAPLAEHELEFVLDHVNVEELPEATLAGEALNETVGADELVTLTLTLPAVHPPSPRHQSVNVFDALSGPTFAEPTVGRFPDQAPDAEQRRALVAAQLSCDCPPTTTLVGDALNESEGRGAAAATPATNSNQHPIRHLQTARASIFLFDIRNRNRSDGIHRRRPALFAIVPKGFRCGINPATTNANAGLTIESIAWIARSAGHHHARNSDRHVAARHDSLVVATFCRSTCC